MATVPASIALTTIADGAQAVAADHRNNFTAVQTALNALITILAGGASGQALQSGGGTTVAWAQPSGYEYAYNEFTAGVTVNATTEGTANTIVTASAVTFDGATPVLVEFFVPDFDCAASANIQLKVVLFDGGSAIGVIGQYQNAAASAINCGPLRLARRLTPSAAAHTYSIRAFVNSNSYSMQAGAGGAGVLFPGYIRITKV